MSYATIVVLLGLSGFVLVHGETTSAILEHEWDLGFKMNIRLQILQKVTRGWTMTLRFTKPAPGLQIWRAKIVSVSSDNKVYELMNMPWSRNLPKCQVFELALRANKSRLGTPAPNAAVEFRGKRVEGDNTNLNGGACPTTAPSATEPTTTTTASSVPKPTTRKAAPSTSLSSTTEKPTILTTPSTFRQTTNAILEHEWDLGFKMMIRLQILEKITRGWTMTLRFTKPAPGLQIWRAKIVSVSSDNKVYELMNMPWNRNLPKCQVFELALRANKSLPGTPTPNATVEFRGKRVEGDNTNLNGGACPTTAPTTTEPTTTTTASTVPKPTTRKAAPSTSLSSTTEKPTIFTTPSTFRQTTNAILEHEWDLGFKMMIRLQILEKITRGWTMTLRFTKPAPGLQIWRAKIVSVSSDNKVYELMNMPWNRNLPKCQVFELALRANKSLPGTPAPNATVEFRGKRVEGDNTNLNDGACPTTAPITTEPTTTTTASTVPKPTTRKAAPSTSLSSTTEKPTIFTTPSTLSPHTGRQTTNAILEHEWDLGFKMIIRLQILQKITGGWNMTLRFTKPAPGLQIWRAKIVSVSSDNKVYELMNMLWNPNLPKCQVFELTLRANKRPAGTPAPSATVEFRGKRDENTNLNEGACTTTAPNLGRLFGA